MEGVLEVWRNLESYYGDLPSKYIWKFCCQKIKGCECVVGLGKRSQPWAPLSCDELCVFHTSLLNLLRQCYVCRCSTLDHAFTDWAHWTVARKVSDNSVVFKSRGTRRCAVLHPLVMMQLVRDFDKLGLLRSFCSDVLCILYPKYTPGKINILIPSSGRTRVCNPFNKLRNRCWKWKVGPPRRQSTEVKSRSFFALESDIYIQTLQDI